MVLKPRPPLRRRLEHGFTLIELMITVVVMGLLLALAFPSYQDSLRKGRRAEAFAALAAVQQAQERHRANRATYAGNLNSTPDADTLRNIAVTTSNGYYTLALSDHTATEYTATATATGVQAADTRCAKLAVRALSGGKLYYGSGATSIDWSTPSAADSGKCWAK
jgi:type IV pilus assembly protein PilE